MPRESREIRKAIEEEVAEWPGASVEFVSAGSGDHPKAKLTFEGRTLTRAYSGNSGTKQGLLSSVRDMRQILVQLGATRNEEPKKAPVDRRHRNDTGGRAARPSPIGGEPAAVKPAIADMLADHPAAGQVDDLEEILAANRTGRPIEDGPPLCPPNPRYEAAIESGAIEDGIYFDMPFEVYKAVERLNGSGLQDLAVSPGTFWQDSWLDPKRKPLDEEQTKAQILGKAYHAARLEPERFETIYCREIDKADYPAETLWNGTEIGEALGELELAKKKAGEKVVEQAERLEAAGFSHPIWPLEEARWKAAIGDRDAIAAKHFDEIVTDMERIHGTPEIASLLSGGAAEVSIFWTDRYGIPMKARLDYLTVEHWDEFKTFDNKRGIVLRQALSNAMRYNRYHIQAVTQRDAVEQIRLGRIQIVGDATDEQRALVAAIQIRPGELRCWYIFQEKNGVPNLLARQFHFFSVPRSVKLQHAGASEAEIAAVEAATRTKTGLHIRALRDVEEAKRLFVLYSQAYPRGAPWNQIEPVGDFEDQDFNQNWLEGHYD